MADGMEIASIVALTAFTVWCMGFGVAQWADLLHAIFGRDKLLLVRAAAGRIHQEMWLFAPPGLLILLSRAVHEHHYWAIFVYLVNVWCWWRYRDWPDDENRWLRRGRKLKEKVAARGGKLVVVPTTS
jgi:hypothetical protein